MNRFAVLWHETPPGYRRAAHFDLLLEAGGGCRTWALELPPDTREETLAERLPDHRTVYLDYEGEVSGDRGHVSQWDAGVCQWLAEGEEAVRVAVAGRRLRGTIELLRDAESPGGWRYRYRAEAERG